MKLTGVYVRCHSTKAVRIAALDRGRFRDRIDGYLNVGWSAASATDVSQVSIGAGVTYRDEIRL
jgi:hypothetical protein